MKKYIQRIIDAVDIDIKPIRLRVLDGIKYDATMDMQISFNELDFLYSLANAQL